MPAAIHCCSANDYADPDRRRIVDIPPHGDTYPPSPCGHIAPPAGQPYALARPNITPANLSRRAHVNTGGEQPRGA
ncbi:MAG: hypothetical protein KC418_15570 [Anaerolineales bacterium]|nr:hypothetical protein [Anaerolineales bacterium]MCB8952062.1 hypothetical protein [Ardenticatenales bacterium]